MKRTAILILSLSLCLILAVFAPARTPGDVDGNGEVTPEDARLALRISVLLETPDEVARAAADIDGDGDVDIQDATLIQRKLAEFEDTYGIGEIIK